MSEQAAEEFVSRVEGDEKFATELAALKDDPQAVQARVRAEGFDADPAEIRAAFLDRYGAELSTEQLDAVAAGMSDQDWANLGIGFGATIGIGAAAALG
jgi:predicted ribosomally synthesized peptide with nif11-like leader